MKLVTKVELIVLLHFDALRGVQNAIEGPDPTLGDQRVLRHQIQSAGATELRREDKREAVFGLRGVGGNDNFAVTENEKSDFSP